MNRAAVRRDPGAIETLLRLRRWTRPHRRAITFMIVTACGAMLAQSLVPLVIGAVVDGPIRTTTPPGSGRSLELALVFGIAEAVLFFARRYAMASAALGLETDLGATCSRTCSGCRSPSTTAGRRVSCCRG